MNSASDSALISEGDARRPVPPLVVREAIESDLPAILALFAQPEMDAGEVLPLAEARAILERMRAYPDYRVYAASLGPAIVGTFSLLVMDNLAHRGARSAIVEDVAVEPAYQSRGIGQAMMREAMALARAKGCYKMALSSNARRTRAHSFYESLGFRRHGISFVVE